MIVKKPRNIDFFALKVSMEKQIEALKKTKDNMLTEKTRLENIKKALKIEESDQLNWISLDLEKINADIKIKEEVLQEYLERTMMQVAIDKRDKQDWKQNNFSVIKAAKLIKNSLFVSKELKTHLKQVLSVNTSGFNEEQKIAWFLALKKEVEICHNYWKNSGETP